MRGIVSLSLRDWYFEDGETYICDTSVLLRCYFAFVLPILEYCSPVWGSAAECYLLLLERQVYSVVRLCSNRSFLSLCHRRRIAGLSMLYKVNANSNHCLLIELASASSRVRYTQAAAAAHPFEFEVSMCRTSQFARCFLPAKVRMCNDLPYTVLTPECWMGSRMQSTVGCFPEFCFLQFSVAQALVALIYKQFRFFRLGLCCWC